MQKKSIDSSSYYKLKDDIQKSPNGFCFYTSDKEVFNLNHNNTLQPKLRGIKTTFQNSMFYAEYYRFDNQDEEQLNKNLYFISSNYEILEVVNKKKILNHHSSSYPKELQNYIDNATQTGSLSNIYKTWTNSLGFQP